MRVDRSTGRIHTMPSHKRNKSAKDAKVSVVTAETCPARQREPTTAQLRRKEKNTTNKKRIKKERAVERAMGRVQVADSTDIKTIWLQREKGHIDESSIDDCPTEGNDPPTPHGADNAKYPL